MPEATTKSGLVIPRGAGGTLGEPKFYCRMCKTNFSQFQPADYVRHIRSCAKANEAELAEVVRNHNEDRMQRPAWADLEYEDAIADAARESQLRGVPFRMGFNRRSKE